MQQFFMPVLASAMCLALSSAAVAQTPSMLRTLDPEWLFEYEPLYAHKRDWRYVDWPDALGVRAVGRQKLTRDLRPIGGLIGRAIDWLVVQQHGSGFWSVESRDRVGATALALLALHSDEYATYQQPVHRALRSGLMALAQAQMEDGAFDAPFDGQQHAVATQLLVEVCSREPLSTALRLRAVAQHAVDRIVRDVHGMEDPREVALSLEALAAAREYGFVVAEDLVMAIRARVLGAVRSETAGCCDPIALLACMRSTKVTDRKWGWFRALRRDHEAELAPLLRPDFGPVSLQSWYALQVSFHLERNKPWLDAWKEFSDRLNPSGSVDGEFPASSSLWGQRVGAVAVGCLRLETYFRLEALDLHDARSFVPSSTPKWDERALDLREMGVVAAKDPKSPDGERARSGLLDAAANEATFLMRSWAVKQLTPHPDVLARMLELLPKAIAMSASAPANWDKEAKLDHRRFSGAWRLEIMACIAKHRERAAERSLIQVAKDATLTPRTRVDAAMELLGLATPNGLDAVIQLRRDLERVGPDAKSWIRSLDSSLTTAFKSHKVNVSDPAPASADDWAALLKSSKSKFRAL